MKQTMSAEEQKQLQTEVASLLAYLESRKEATTHRVLTLAPTFVAAMVWYQMGTNKGQWREIAENIWRDVTDAMHKSRLTAALNKDQAGG